RCSENNAARHQSLRSIGDCICDCSAHVPFVSALPETACQRVGRLAESKLVEFGTRNCRRDDRDRLSGRLPDGLEIESSRPNFECGSGDSLDSTWRHPLPRTCLISDDSGSFAVHRRLDPARQMTKIKGMSIPYYHIDSFTGELFAGNPAGVCVLSSFLPDSTMQNIAAENRH